MSTGNPTTNRELLAACRALVEWFNSQEIDPPTAAAIMADTLAAYLRMIHKHHKESAAQSADAIVDIIRDYPNFTNKKGG